MKGGEKMLYILRHADAEKATGPSARDDGERPLTDKGRSTARQVGKWIKKREIHVDAVVTSPLVRARETADLVAEVLGVETVETDDRISSGASPADFREALASRREQALVVCGHEPDLGVFLADLLGFPDAAIPLKKGGLAAVTLEATGEARLLFLLPPSCM